MTDNGKKMPPEKRQELIRNTLKDRIKPVTATEFARKTNVSRQVIVQDVSILKAKNEPILATSQGYIYIKNEKNSNRKTKTIVVNHRPEETRKELYTIVDHGVTVKNVSVEHPVYGELTASIQVSTRKEVDLFYEKLTAPNAEHLSALTNGLHLHTIEADSMEKIEAACHDLQKAGILVANE